MARKSHYEPVGICPACGKWCYVSKTDARKARRAKHPGDSMSEYRCGDYWHFGHSHLIHLSAALVYEPLPPRAIRQIHAMMRTTAA